VPAEAPDLVAAVVPVAEVVPDLVVAELVPAAVLVLVVLVAAQVQA
jgi:hypothetical protein